jgi:hypothetical protein
MFNECFIAFLTLEFTHVFILFIENAKAFSEDLFSITHHFLIISQKIILIAEKLTTIITL